MRMWADYMVKAFDAVSAPSLQTFNLDQDDPDMVDVRKSWQAAALGREYRHGKLGDTKGKKWRKGFKDHSSARKVLWEKLGAVALSPPEVAREAAEITKSNPSNWSGLLGCREADIIHLHLFCYLFGIPSP